MEIHIKMAPAQYERLRRGFPTDSPIRGVIDNATRIDHAVEGVLFAGYRMVCNENEARILLETARRCCPEAIPDVEQAIRLAHRG